MKKIKIEDKSKYYLLGFNFGFKSAILSVMRNCNDKELIYSLIKDYNSYPGISQIDIKDIKSDEHNLDK